MRTILLMVSIFVILTVAGTNPLVAQKKKVKLGKDFLLQMERSPCRGNCPAYVLTVDASGKVSYEGKRSVKNIGKYKKTLPTTKLKEIVAAMNASNYFSFSEKYDNENIADAVTWTISYTNRGQTRQVIDRYGAPESLKNLQEKLEKIIGEDGYLKDE